MRYECMKCNQGEGNSGCIEQPWRLQQAESFARSAAFACFREGYATERSWLSAPRRLKNMAPKQQPATSNRYVIAVPPSATLTHIS